MGLLLQGHTEAGSRPPSPLTQLLKDADTQPSSTGAFSLLMPFAEAFPATSSLSANVYLRLATLPQSPCICYDCGFQRHVLPSE